ncbi:MAG: DMT family transporter [Burkholderiaceae bacterium]
MNLPAGVAWALVAGVLWGTVFIVPVILHDYPAVVLSVSRYLAFGLIALPLALASRSAIAQLERADWIEAAKLSLVGNLLYYSFAAAAIQRAGAPLPTVIVGSLPVVIAIASNLGTGARVMPWRQLVLPLALLAAGILLVNRDELLRLAAADTDAPGGRLLSGALLAFAAVACWTWYPIRNAAWLRARPGLRSETWTTAQGLTTLPLSLVGWLAIGALDAAGLARHDGFDWPLGPRPLLFVLMMLAIGLLASWLGSLCWNRASRLLPTSLAGQLIVFETLSALAMGFAWRGQWPAPGTWLGVALLVAGVAAGVHAFSRRAAAG